MDWRHHADGDVVDGVAAAWHVSRVAFGCDPLCRTDSMCRAYRTAAFIWYHIPGLDKYLEDRYGDEFREYAARTKRFVPLVW